MTPLPVPSTKRQSLFTSAFFLSVLLSSPLTAQTHPAPDGPPLAYRAVENWAKLPDGLNLGECSGVAVDKSDNVWVFNRGSHPVIEFDRNGKMLQAWNDVPVKSSHGIRVDPEGNIWLIDVAGHKVLKMSPSGHVLMVLGAVGGATGDQNAKYAFNRPTNVGFGADGSFFITDGYGNSRIAKYTKDGEYITQWGSKGTGDNQFNIVHDIAIDKAGKLYIADRENDRIQIFDQSGKFLGKWPNLGAAWGLVYIPGDNAFFLSDGANDQIIKLDANGKILGKLGSHGKGPGKLHYPHSLAVDSTGALYVAEVLNWRVQKFVPSE
jgi:DNA-binding beta-propeller fold protein YncE